MERRLTFPFLPDPFGLNLDCEYSSGAADRGGPFSPGARGAYPYPSLGTGPGPVLEGENTYGSVLLRADAHPELLWPAELGGCCFLLPLEFILILSSSSSKRLQCIDGGGRYVGNVGQLRQLMNGC
jgi:hypothetical protein